MTTCTPDKLEYLRDTRRTRKRLGICLVCGVNKAERPKTKCKACDQKEKVRQKDFHTRQNVQDYDLLVENKLIPSKEVAQILHTSLTSVQRLVKRGLLHPKKHPSGRYQVFWYFTMHEVDKVRRVIKS